MIIMQNFTYPKLTPFQQQVLVGLILGDLFIQRRKPTHNSYLMFKQSAHNKEYMFHLYEIFKEFCLMKPKVISFNDKRNDQTYSSVVFNTRSLSCFNSYRELFYPIGIKDIPENIGNLLTPISLAYWIMDDGTKERKGFIICTDSFSKDKVI